MQYAGFGSRVERWESTVSSFHSGFRTVRAGKVGEGGKGGESSSTGLG